MEQIRHITSRDNPSIKHAKSVREGREKGLIFIEGVRLVEEALRSGLTIREAFVSMDRLDSAKVVAVTGELKSRGSTVHTVSAKIADSLSDTKSGQGVVAIGEQPTAMQLSDLAIDGRASIPLILFLDEVNNPSNLGAVIRTAEAAGVVGVITSIRSADPYSPKALRASMGSAFRLPIVTDVDINSLSDWARR